MGIHHTHRSIYIFLWWRSRATRFLIVLTFTIILPSPDLEVLRGMQAIIITSARLLENGRFDSLSYRRSTGLWAYLQKQSTFSVLPSLVWIKPGANGSPDSVQPCAITSCGWLFPMANENKSQCSRPWTLYVVPEIFMAYTDMRVLCVVIQGIVVYDESVLILKI